LKNLLILIGDSLTFGYGVPKSKGWVYRLNKEYNINLLNKGVNGNTSTDMLSRFTVEVLSKKTDSIFIMAGTNDFLSNRSLNCVLENIELMVKEGLTITKDIIIGIPPTIIKEMAYEKFMEASTYDYTLKNLVLLKEGLIDLSSKYSIKYLDFYTLTLNNLDKDIFLDGIHLNEKGNDFILKEFIKNIN
jgi:acyl-CoA thioesterase I